MGMILIQVRGSFPVTGDHRETALEGGHAAALGRAIEYLTRMLPDAIARDHELHSNSDRPRDAPWGRHGGVLRAPGPLNHGHGPNSTDPADRQELARSSSEDSAS